MYIDGALQFSGTAGSVSDDTPTTGTQTSTNIIDLVNARDLGIGNIKGKLLAQVRTAFTGGTSLQVSLQGAPDNGSGAPGTYTTYVTGPTILEAALVVGARLLDVDIPRAVGALPRFLRLQYVSAGTHAAGALYASIVLDRDDHIQYPARLTVEN